MLLAKGTISAEAAAKRLGIDIRTLYASFGTLAKNISARYNEHKAEINQDAIAERHAAIAAAFKKVVDTGLIPSRKRVAAEIREHGRFPNPKDREFFNQLRSH